MLYYSRWPVSASSAASLPPKVVKRILGLEFVKMAKLRGDIWSDDSTANDGTNPAHRLPGKPPVHDIKVRLECFARMAAVLVTRFSEKGPELWAYQTSIMKAAHNYEGSNWVAYDRQYRRGRLVRRDFNWSVPDARLYNEAFTGRAKSIPRCPDCLSEDHGGASCPHKPTPQCSGGSIAHSSLLCHLEALKFRREHPPHQEICRNFNENRCRFSRCRFLHALCLECSGPHAAMYCPRCSASVGKRQLEGASTRISLPRTEGSLPRGMDGY